MDTNPLADRAWLDTEMSCGSNYTIYMTAYNHIGHGHPSGAVNARDYAVKTISEQFWFWVVVLIWRHLYISPCCLTKMYRVCIRTLGRVPDVPVPSRLMSVNKTVITLDLEAFGDGGCPILYFVIEYR